MAYYKEDKQIGGIVRILPGESTACLTFDINIFQLRLQQADKENLFIIAQWARAVSLG